MQCPTQRDKDSNTEHCDCRELPLANRFKTNKFKSMPSPSKPHLLLFGQHSLGHEEGIRNLRDLRLQLLAENHRRMWAYCQHQFEHACSFVARSGTKTARCSSHEHPFRHLTFDPVVAAGYFRSPVDGCGAKISSVRPMLQTPTSFRHEMATKTGLRMMNKTQ